MRKSVIMLAVAALLAAHPGCKDDDDDDEPEWGMMPSFQYADILIGTWDSYACEVDGEMVKMTSSLFQEQQFSAAFRADGTYTGTGYFGDGDGTYRAEDSTVITYVDGKEYLRYRILDVGLAIIKFSRKKRPLATVVMLDSQGTHELRVQMIKRE